MENIILSLLLLKKMTVYELRSYIRQNLNTICSDSMGSIQAAIKKLLDKQRIECREFIENSVLKKEYSITQKGVMQFKEWIQTPVKVNSAKNMEGGKLLFLGLSSKENRIKFIEQYINELKQEQKKLLQIQESVELLKDNVILKNAARISGDKVLSKNILELSGEKSIEEAVQNIYDYQILSLEYGLNRLKLDIEFYQSILKKELD